MKDSPGVKWTRALVLGGIFLSYLSYPTEKLGWDEIYPFAHWRLFSEPVGINEPATAYRVYIRSDSTEDWRRVALSPSATMTRKEQGYVLNYWAAQYLRDTTNADIRSRLRTAAETIAPEESSSYRVVAETFLALPIYEDSTQYDTTTVVRFSR